MYAGVLEMAQKVIEGGIVTWRYMHDILRWLNFKLAQNLDHVSKLRNGSLFQTWNSEMAQNSKQSKSRIEFLFEFWAISEFSIWATSEFWQVIEILSQFEIEPSQNIMHMPSVKALHVTTPPSMTFWAISRTPRIIQFEITFLYIGWIPRKLLFFK